ncbi:MAG: hypothetical protein K6F99_02995 [Lachnospiraceae bacterium]|nr:hypothetical protein [Lachnospiraceae bacterium]
MEKIKNAIKKYYIALILFFCVILNLAALYFKPLESIQNFYVYHSQSMYHEDFMDEGRYPDLYLRAVARDKNVRVAREVQDYSAYPSYGRDEEESNPFSKEYLIDNDYIRYFGEYAKKVTTDKTLPFGEDVKKMMEGHEADFADLGIANDLLRYSFALNHEEVQQARAFWYYWYYHAFPEKKPNRDEAYPRVYVNPDEMAEEDELVALWDENENLYLMSSRYYEDIIEGGEDVD